MKIEVNKANFRDHLLMGLRLYLHLHPSWGRADRLKSTRALEVDMGMCVPECVCVCMCLCVSVYLLECFNYLDNFSCHFCLELGYVITHFLSLVSISLSFEGLGLNNIR